MKRAARCSELHDVQSWNEFEVTDVVGPNGVAEFQRHHADQEIGKWDTDALRPGLAVDLASA